MNERYILVSFDDLFIAYFIYFYAWPNRLGRRNSPTAPPQRGKTPHTHTHTNVCPGYDTKQADGEVPVMLALWGMWSTPSLPLFPGPLWPRAMALNRVLFMGQIELNSVLMQKWIVWNRTVYMYKNGFGIK